MRPVLYTTFPFKESSREIFSRMTKTGLTFCKEYGYLKQLVAYIHLNPFRAGIVEDAASLAIPPPISALMPTS
ncbi:MAG: hypothetical protein JRK53_24030 [Deltaproteobacteria bacterium]|nr:hypothetical protein [Deltaproteobacteria bacterium]